MLSTPDPLDLQCVVTLAEILNFSETAKRLNMTQPGVSAHINKVEKASDISSLSGRKALSTRSCPKASSSSKRAKQILDHLHRLVARSDAAHRAFSETLSISRSHHADLQLLSIVVAAQAIEGSHISIKPPCASDEEAIAMLLNGEADAALVSWPVNEGEVTALHLIHDPLVAVVPENHALRNRKEVHIVDFRNEQIIESKFQFPATLKTDLGAKCKALGFTPEWVCITASPAESVHLVDAGARPGITIVTKQYARELALSKAACIPFADNELAEYGAAYRQTDHRPILNAFLQYLADRCQPPQRNRKRKRQQSVLGLNPKTAG